jgi:hypothetical protein
MAREKVIKVFPPSGADVELQAEVQDTLQFFLFRKEMLTHYLYAEG